MKLKLSLFIMNALFFLTIQCAEKMRLYAIYTPSHKVLKDKFFLPSIQDNFEVILKFHEQTCPTAKFLSKGWTKTTIKKIDLIIHAIEENWGNVFIFSDVDIQFFGPIEKVIMKSIEGKDLVIQKNCPNGVLCSGFFACRANEKTLQLWKDVKKVMETTQLSDQKALNRCIKRQSKKNPYNVVWDYLPTSFFGGGTLTGRVWSIGKRLPIPRDILMHHANWTVGITNKIAQLLYVKKVVKKRKISQR